MTGRVKDRPGGTDRSGAAIGSNWPDLRLAGAALGCWLSALSCLYLPVRAGLLLAAGAGATALGICAGIGLLTRAAARQRVGGAAAPPTAIGDRVLIRAGWIAVTVLIGAVCGAAITAARVVERDAEPLAGLAARHTTVRADLVVTDDPRPVRAGRGPRAYAIPARFAALDDGAGTRVRLTARVLILATDLAWRGLLPGQRVSATGRLSSPRGGDLRAALLSIGTPPESVAAPPWIQRAAGGLRAGLRLACRPLPPEPGGLLPGLVVGDTTGLDPAVADAFRATGMTHLVAVSGSNCAIIVTAVLLLVRWCRAGPVLSAVLCGLGLAGFVVLARPSPSVLRAAAMGGLALVALATGRSRAAVPALAAAVVVLVAVDPELAGDPGFALSVLATGGLLLLAPRWIDGLRRRGVPAGLAEALAVPGAAQVACAPVVAAISATVSLTAVPANLLAVPAVAPATILGVGAALCSPVWLPAAEFLAWLASWPARWLVWLARTGADTPAGLLPWPGGTFGGLLLAAVLLGGLGAARIPVIRRIALVTAVAAVVGALPVRLIAAGWPPPGWIVVACDVGQGDAIVLPAGPGEAVVVDTGPEPAAVDRCLRRLGVRRVPLLLVTHFHADHVGGLPGVLRARAGGALLVPDFAEPAAGRAAVYETAAAWPVPVQPARAGSTYVIGAVRLDVIGPNRPMTGTRSDPNNNSVIARATVGRHTILLTGDAETEEQRAMTTVGVRADVLKLAHHGSAYQEPEFLGAVRPAVALVSVGRQNDYGHPNPGVLARLARDGARVLRTDADGDLAVVAQGSRLAVVTRGRDPGMR